MIQKSLKIDFLNATLILKDEDGRAMPKKGRFKYPCITDEEERFRLRSLLLVLMGERPVSSIESRQIHRNYFVDEKILHYLDNVILPTARVVLENSVEHLLYVRAEPRAHPGPAPDGETLSEIFLSDLKKLKSENPGKWDDLLPGETCRALVAEAKVRARGESSTPEQAALYDSFEKVSLDWLNKKTLNSRATLKDYYKVRTDFLSLSGEFPVVQKKRLLVRGNPSAAVTFDGSVEFKLTGNGGEDFYRKIYEGPRYCSFLKHGIAWVANLALDFQDLEPWVSNRTT